jgi:hypothetical protein
VSYYTLQDSRVVEVEHCPPCAGSGWLDDKDPCGCMQGLLLRDATCRNDQCRRLIADDIEPDPSCIWCGGSGVDGHDGSWRSLNWSTRPRWSRHPNRLPSIEHDGDHYHLELVQLALKLRTNGRRQEALSILRQAARRAPESESAWAWFEIGHMLFEDRDFTAAADAFARSYGVVRDPVAAEWERVATRESERGPKRHW